MIFLIVRQDDEVKFSTEKIHEGAPRVVDIIVDILLEKSGGPQPTHQVTSDHLLIPTSPYHRLTLSPYPVTVISLIPLSIHPPLTAVSQ